MSTERSNQSASENLDNVWPPPIKDAGHDRELRYAEVSVVRAQNRLIIIHRRLRTQFVGVLIVILFAPFLAEYCGYRIIVATTRSLSVAKIQQYYLLVRLQQTGSNQADGDLYLRPPGTGAPRLFRRMV